MPSVRLILLIPNARDEPCVCVAASFLLLQALSINLETFFVKPTSHKYSEHNRQEMELNEIPQPESTSTEAISLPTVVILGRPNVGKSTLFNKLTGRRRAIVGDEPGITRDRIYGRAEWRGRQFSLVDTGGIIPDDTDLIPANILVQARNALAEARLIVFVVDARTGITPLDAELATLARETGIPVFVAANKVDTAKLEADSLEFERWGLDAVFPISAEHGTGVAEMLDAVLEIISPPEVTDPISRTINVAIVGRPNVGKSSLVNRLVGE